VRDEVRGQIEHFVEVFVDTPLDVCEERDVKGLYSKARAGEIAEFTGVSDPYEPPPAPEVRLVTADRDAKASAAQVVDYLQRVGLTGPAPRPEAARARS
jgi:adenylylsulfate kinase